MKIFRGKAFFFKTILLQIFLIIIIAFISTNFLEKPIYDLISSNLIHVKKNGVVQEGSPEIALVVADDESYKTFRTPWPRALYAEIIEYLKYSGAKVIVFDFVLSSLDTEHPKTSDEYFFKTVSETPNFIGGTMTLPQEYKDKNIGNLYDKNFSKFSIDNNNLLNSYYKSLLIMPDEYFNSLNSVGMVNLNLDTVDGVLRLSNDLINYNGKYYPSLALKTYLMVNNTNEISINKKNIIVNKTGLKVPIINDNGDIRHCIKFYKNLDGTNYSHKKYSAGDVIKSNRLVKNGQNPIVSPAMFKDKIVFIGAYAMGAEDALETSAFLKQPGVDIQATILDNFLKNDFLVNLPNWLNISIIIILSVITFVIIRTFSFLPSLLVLLLMGILYFILCIFCFMQNIVPYVITPLTVQLSTMIFGYSYRFILEGKNKEKIKNAMGKYLSQDIMKNVVKNIDDIKLGGKKANVTVLFSDIRGFTSMSEKMTAEEVSVILNEYFSEIEPIITKYNGVINKFIGDAVMAIFGEPIQDINHAKNSVKCACEMLKKVEKLREKWLLEGKPKIEIGIGINTGEAFVGNIGSENRLEYTVIGDTVNLASRIESYNKVYKTNLLISSSTYSKVSEIVDVIKIADVTIRGKSKKMDIYEVLRLN